MRRTFVRSCLVAAPLVISAALYACADEDTSVPGPKPIPAIDASSIDTGSTSGEGGSDATADTGVDAGSDADNDAGSDATTD